MILHQATICFFIIVMMTILNEIVISNDTAQRKADDCDQVNRRLCFAGGRPEDQASGNLL